jgi:hypothetical protein
MSSGLPQPVVWHSALRAYHRAYTWGYTSRVPPVYLGGGTRRPAANLTSARAQGAPAPG